MTTAALDWSQQHRRTNHSSEQPAKKRLAIVGCGPRGLQCLETLSRRLSPEQLENLEISIYEPADHPGAGTVYDISQPWTLRMNLATEHIDFWKSSPDHVTNRSQSLIGWLARQYPQFAIADSYIPRAVVGEYLSEIFNTVVGKLRQQTTVNIYPTTVTAIDRSSSGWVLTSREGRRHFDSVVITTGHEGLRASESLLNDDQAGFVYPASENLSAEKIHPGANVLIRGFGLTAIDAILMLTEERGGSFQTLQRLLPDYERSGMEPQCITVVSRSGRPMLAKPTAKVEPVDDHFWEPFREQLNSFTINLGHLNFKRNIWNVIIQATSDQMQASGQSCTAKRVDDWFRSWARFKMTSVDGLKAMTESCAAAYALRPRSIPMALGESWRKLYPEITSLISYGGLCSKEWDRFQLVNREMERIAFGPPADNVAKMIRLARNGLLRLRCDIPDNDSMSRFDVVLSAVIASPLQRKIDGPLAKLVQSEIVPLDQTTGAVKVNSEGYLDGTASDLAVFGRATEGCVIGNDTLSRTLHDQIERWANSIERTIHA